MPESQFIESINTAWAAGLFEGEGSIGVKHSHRYTYNYRYLRLQLDTTDRDVLERFVTIVGVGKLYGGQHGYTTSGTNLPVWKWIVSGVAAHEVAELLRPFFGARRTARLKEVLEEVNPC